MTAPQSRVGVAFPVGATHPTPDVDTWLDERTEAELQPPCDANYGVVPCLLPAVWAVLLHCPTHGTRPLRLHCERCFAFDVAGQTICRSCKPGRIAARLIWSERIR